MKKILEVNNLTKIIGKRKILDNINFSIEKGKIYGIVGVNGAGKSTLLKIIVGLIKPTCGVIKIDGHDTRKNYESAMQNVGSMIEVPAMYDYLTGMENLELFKTMFKNVEESRVRDIVKLVSLEGSIYKKLKTYSLGMRQRLGLAQALINNPKLLILDEPTNGLDPIGIKDLREFLKTLKNTTIFISSHILSEIENICDEVLFLDKGKIIGNKVINQGLNVKKRIKFDVDNVQASMSVLNNYDFNSNLELDIDDDEVPIINEKLVLKGIKVFRICEVSDSLEKEFLSEIGSMREHNE